MDGTTPSGTPGRRVHTAVAFLILGLLVVLAGTTEAAKLRISNQYSHHNRQRPPRERTDYLVLHTTEGSNQPSLARIKRGGLAHYVVLTDGRVHRVMKRGLVARHAGRSMWNGDNGLDKFAIGIEVVGYHNKPLRKAQISALAELIRQLQSAYDIPDDRVLTHSMVAYGRPNRWHSHNHRGRKRCGMQFARPELRHQLGLEDRPGVDPDVVAGRLTVGDPFLATVLYGADPRAEAVAQAEFTGPDANTITADRTAWFIARDRYDDAATVYIFPSGTRLRGDQIRNWSRMPEGTRVLLGQDIPPVPDSWLVMGRDGSTASEVAGNAYNLRSTVYVRPDGRIQHGHKMKARDFRRLPVGTRVFLGFEYAGQVSRRRTAYDLCGPRFRHDTTLYLLPSGGVRKGDEIRENRIPGGTHILMGS